MTSDEFSRSVDTGLKLSKRVYYGKDKLSMSAPKPEVMTKSLSSCTSASSFRLTQKHLPTAPMVFAVITNPNIVDNPDITSYQPHVHGRCNPPALIPLQMHGITMEVDCYLDTAFVTVTGTWHLHCVTASACSDCRIAIPMGEQGSVLGVEVESTRRSYFTKLIAPEDEKDADRAAKAKDGFLMKPNTYTLKVPQVEGGSFIHVKARWFQKLLYQNDEFRLSVPFTFPPYVLPLEKRIPKREQVLLNVNSCTGTLIKRGTSTHPLKELRRQAGEVSFLYEAEVLKWSNRDFSFAYSVCSNEIFGGLLLQTPSVLDYDQRDMFCFYLFPGTNKDTKHFKKEVVILVDTSASMKGDPLEKSKDAVTASLSKLNKEDSFNIIAFNENVQTFSSSLVLATEEALTDATEWMWKNYNAEGGTNLMHPLKQAIDMVGKNGDSFPLIFLVTDGTVEDEREICNMIKDCVADGGPYCPRICTFGIGTYCNHYFLQMLAHTGRGYYDAAYDIDSINERMQRLLDNASSPMLANVTIDDLENLESYELYPSRLPDLLSGSPLIISGRCQGNLPDFVKARGFLADQSTCVIDINVRKTMDINMDRVCAKREMDILTALAWLEQNTQLEQQVAEMSLQTGIPSEYTNIILVQNDKVMLDEKCSKLMNEKLISLRNLGVGFGNLKATALHLPPGIEEVKFNEAAMIMMKAASSCWGTFASSACGSCMIKSWNQLKDNRFALAMAELCAALACFEMLDCCCDLCDSCMDLCQ